MCDVFPVNVSKFYNSPLYFFVTKCGLFVKYSFLFVMCYSFCISYKYCYCCRCWSCPNFILNLIMCLPLAMYLLFSHVCLFNSYCVCLCLFIFIMFCLYYMYVCMWLCVCMSVFTRSLLLTILFDFILNWGGLGGEMFIMMWIKCVGMY